MARRHFTPIALLFALSAALTALGSPAAAEERGQRRQRGDGQSSGQGSQGREPSSQRQDGGDSWRGRDWQQVDDRGEPQRQPDDWRSRHHDDRGDLQGRNGRDDSDWRRRADDRYRHDDRHGNDWNRSRRYVPTYRYRFGGRSYDTDDYGAQFIRNALRHGYEQGVRAAQRARASRWGYDVRGCDAYRDGSYGYDGYDGYSGGNYYGGNYYGGGYGFRFDRGQYSVYFRQGFQRGYDEAYYGRYHYGSYRNGGVHVVVDLLDLILDLRRLH